MLTAFVVLVVGATCFFQLVYLAGSWKVALRPAPPPPAGPPPERVSVVIPAYQAAATLERCLGALPAAAAGCVAEVVVVLDRCTDGSGALAASLAPRFAAAGIPLRIERLPDGAAGKVAALLRGGAGLATPTALLLDADIVLAPGAVRELVEHHRAAGTPFSSCLIFPLQDPGEAGTLTAHFICNNRLYRQGVLQLVKDRFGVANFPGGVQMVDFARYAALLADGFLEDLTATYRVLATGGRIAILPRVLAWEVERQSIGGLFLQRVRWTVGALQHIGTQVRAASARRAWSEKVLVNSYHVMWELQHYVIALGIVAAPWSPALRPLLLAPLACYVLQVARAARLGRGHYRNSVAGVAFHCLGFSLVISAALVGSCALLLRERRFFFRTALLYRRT